MKRVKLREIASNETPMFPKKGAIWNLSLDEIESGSGVISKRTTTEVASLGPSKVCFDERYVLYSKLRPYLNKVVLPDKPGVGTSELIPILPNSKALKREYLAIYLRSNNFLNYTKAFITGANLPRLSAKALWEHKIPLPPLEDQARIAHLLGKVESLIAQRKKDALQLDQLLKSVFLQMFGDPVINEKGWEKRVIGDLLESIDSGWSPKCEARRSGSNDEWGVLKLGAVTSCEYKEDENKALIGNFTSKSKIEVRSGDILFTRKNTCELVAACAYVFKTRPKLLMPDLIFRLVLKKDANVNPLYLWKLLNNQSQRKVIQALAGGAAGSMPNISKEKLLQQLIPIPRLSIQKHFAAIVEKIEVIKIKYQNSLIGLESFYNVLSQKAFRGELDLTRIPINLTVRVSQPLQIHAEFAAPTIKVNQAESEDYFLRHAFTRKDIEIALTKLGGPQSFTKLLAELEKIAAIDLKDYESIHTVLYQMLSENQLAQVFDENKKEKAPVASNPSEEAVPMRLVLR